MLGRWWPAIGLSWIRAIRWPSTWFSHDFIYRTNLANPKGADERAAVANKYLKSIPGIWHFHVGKVVASHRPVGNQSYQVALNLVFTNKKAQSEEQTSEPQSPY